MSNLAGWSCATLCYAIVLSDRASGPDFGRTLVGNASTSVLRPAFGHDPKLLNCEITQPNLGHLYLFAARTKTRSTHEGA